MSTPEDTTRDEVLRNMLVSTFTGRVEHTAQSLRDLADRIEAEGKRINRIPTRGTTSAAALASTITHSIVWGLANASPDGIVSAAAEFDFHMAREGGDRG